MFTNKRKMVMALIFVSSVMATGLAFAEPKTTAAAQAGLALPLVGDMEDIANTGVFVGIQAMQAVTAQKSYGLGISYATFGEDSEGGVDTEVSIISTMALIQRALAGKSGRSPYIEGGFGFARTQVNIAASNAGGPAITRGSNEEDISPTFLLGAGFDTPLGDGASFGASVNYQHFFFKVGDVDGGGSLNILAHLRI